MSAEKQHRSDSGSEGEARGRDKYRLWSLWLASSEGQEALACQRRLWARLTEGARRQRVLLIESPVEAWCALIKEQGFFLTVSPRLSECLENENGSSSADSPAETCELPFSDDEFDLAALIGGLEYLPNPGQALAEAARVSRRGVVVITRNGAWPARLRAAAANKRADLQWPSLENWFSASALERLVRGFFELRNFRVLSAGSGSFFKGPCFDHWLGCYFSPSYTMVADGLLLTNEPQVQMTKDLKPATSSRQLKCRAIQAVPYRQGRLAG